ncbi:hypothetical protein GJ496_009232 [Pomphorhynchus laevis]|nr:hypothetical protein GJ496_009232 [Pomphorhynchus laevis]
MKQSPEDVTPNIALGDLLHMKESNCLNRTNSNEKFKSYSTFSDGRKRRNQYRKNNDSPVEMSSKKPSHAKQIKKNNLQYEVRDPRFNSKCGAFNPKWFVHSYSFLTDIRDKEINLMNQTLANCTDESDAEQLRRQIQRLQHQNEHMLIQKRNDEKEQTLNKALLQTAKIGNHIPFLRKSEKKILMLADKYRELKANGKVQSYLDNKKRKQEKKSITRRQLQNKISRRDNAVATLPLYLPFQNSMYVFPDSLFNAIQTHPSLYSRTFKF